MEKLPVHLENQLKIYMGKILSDMDKISSQDEKFGFLLNKIATYKIFMLLNDIETCENDHC